MESGAPKEVGVQFQEFRNERFQFLFEFLGRGRFGDESGRVRWSGAFLVIFMGREYRTFRGGFPSGAVKRAGGHIRSSPPQGSSTPRRKTNHPITGYGTISWGVEAAAVEVERAVEARRPVNRRHVVRNPV